MIKLGRQAGSLRATAGQTFEPGGAPQRPAMNPSVPGEQARSRAAYVSALLSLYVSLPPPKMRRASADDRRLAAQLYDQGLPLTTVQTAILLAVGRRDARFPGLPPLPPIHSLAYFLPVIEELRLNPPDPGYLGYLLRRRQRDQIPAASDER